ncbi:ATP-binding protein [Kitasatospora azatica]|uniref:ATP-binding protein n=1 Tax=Kitasatospora azatica TaxID=58347 RepID=UPI000691BBF6|nr:ATP-binding protein [Kitasatospora azatica]
MTRRWRRRRPEPSYTPHVPAATRREREHTLALATAPTSIPLARRATQLAFTSWGMPPQATALGAALLIVTELVTNAVRHAAEFSPPPC